MMNLILFFYNLKLIAIPILTSVGSYSNDDNLGNEEKKQNIVANFNISEETRYVGSVLQFMNESTGIDSNTTYLMGFGDGASSSLRNPSHTYKELSDYIVKLPINNSTTDNTISKKVAISLSNSISERKPLLEALNDLNGNIMVCAHRGNHNNAPENSLKSIQDAIDEDIEMVELDIRQTEDGELVLMHDVTIDRTTNGLGYVSDFTLQELQHFNLYLENGILTNEKIPTLREVLEMSRGKIYLDLDIDRKVSFNPVYSLVNQYDMLDQVLFYSSELSVITEMVNVNNPNIIPMPIVRNQNDFDQYQNLSIDVLQFNVNDNSLKQQIQNEEWYIFRNAYVNTNVTPQSDNFSQLNEVIDIGGSIVQTDYPLGVKNHLLSLDQEAPTVEVVWTYDLPYYSTNTSVAVADDGTVYVGTDGKSTEPTRGDYNFFAIKNGTLEWGYTTEEVVRASPSIAVDGTIYFGDYNGELVALNSDGSEKWRVDLGNRIKYSSPSIAADGTIYIGMEDDDTLHAINPADGTINWSFPVGHDIRATPVIDSNGVVYVASSDDYFYAINPDGTEKWKTIYGDYTAGTPAIVENINTIYLSGKTSDNTGHVIAFNMSDGSITWDNGNRLLAKTEQGGPTVATDGTIYLGGEDNKMIAYNPDGTEKWSFESSTGRILAAPAIDNNGNLYFGNTAGTFYVIDSEGNNKWRASRLDEDIRSSAAIGNDGTIYILTRNNTNKTGTLYALKTDATGLMNSEWPMLSRTARHSGLWQTLSIPKNTIQGFEIYPNPVEDDEFYISTSSNRAKSIQIFDILGEQVYSYKTEPNEKITTSNLRTGVYIVKVMQDKKIATSKLVIH